MKRPIANMIGCDINRELLARFDDDSVFAGFVVTSAIHEVKEHAVQMDRVWHHRVIDEGEPDALAHWITEGNPHVGMPGFGKHLTAAQVLSLVELLESKSQP